MNKKLDSYSFQIISIGNELLNGKTINNNLNWLSESITSLGCEVICGYVILDKIDEILTAADRSVFAPLRQGAGFLFGLRAALSAFRGDSSQPQPPFNDGENSSPSE